MTNKEPYDIRMISIFEELEMRTTSELLSIINYASAIVDSRGAENRKKTLRETYGDE